MTLSQDFDKLASEWVAATAYLSSVTKMAEHPACHRIIGMGQDVIPLVLDRMARESAKRAGPDPRWFEVLRTLTGADPTPQDGCGNTRKMGEHWLTWGKENGYDAKLLTEWCLHEIRDDSPSCDFCRNTGTKLTPLGAEVAAIIWQIVEEVEELRDRAGEYSVDDVRSCGPVR